MAGHLNKKPNKKPGKPSKVKPGKSKKPFFLFGKKPKKKK